MDAEDMTTKETVIYCGSCEAVIERLAGHKGHSIKVGTRYETIGQEVLAAHDAAQSQERVSSQSGLDLK